MPLAEHCRGVALLGKQLRQQFFIGIDAGGAGVIQGTFQADSVGIAAAHQGGSRGGADGLHNIEISEPGALVNEPVDVWCFDC